MTIEPEVRSPGISLPLSVLVCSASPLTLFFSGSFIVEGLLMQVLPRPDAVYLWQRVEWAAFLLLPASTLAAFAAAVVLWKRGRRALAALGFMIGSLAGLTAGGVYYILSNIH